MADTRRQRCVDYLLRRAIALAVRSPSTFSCPRLDRGRHATVNRRYALHDGCFHERYPLASFLPYSDLDWMFFSPSSTTYVLLLSNLSLLLLVWFDLVSLPPICVSAYIPFYPTRLLSLVPVPLSFLLFVIFYLPPSLTPQRFPSSLLSLLSVSFGSSPTYTASYTFSPSRYYNPTLSRTSSLVVFLSLSPSVSIIVPLYLLLSSRSCYPFTCRCRDDEMISLMYFYV